MIGNVIKRERKIKYKDYVGIYNTEESYPRPTITFHNFIVKHKGKTICHKCWCGDVSETVSDDKLYEMTRNFVKEKGYEKV